MKKFPPIEKIYEAWTAIADDRVHLHNDYAEVESSDGKKNYIVRFHDNLYSSDDNATYWQGYPGYPVIAVLMLKGLLPYNPDEIQKWKGINWNQLNKSHRNKYSEALKEIASERHINLEESLPEAEAVMTALKQLPIEIKRKI